jgi:hydroxymethylglutaryl-CoA reductase (NADPH)
MVAKKEEIIKKIMAGEIPLYKAEEYLAPKDAADARRSIIEFFSNTKLNSIGSSNLDYSQISNKNAENVIGHTQIPLGVAGPIIVNGTHAKGKFYVPMATTEGALIASENRGMKAVSLSGGATVRVLKNAMARAPLFEFDSITDVERFLKWIDDHKEGIKTAAEATTNHGKLKEFMPFVLGNNVWLRLSFDTGDAMGMNMVTIASEAAAEYIEEKFDGAKMVTVSGNMCSDKRESAVNNLLGRGKTVVCEAIIKENIVTEVFRTTAAVINNTNLKKNLLGNARAGSARYSGHSGNMIAAIFAATGQDLAQVSESSSCYTWTELRGKDLYISVTLPSLEVGTIGGGSVLPTQKEALSIMGVAGGGTPAGSNSLKFAEIVAAAVLAGELNLIAAQSTRELGKAHKKLGRNVKN